MVGAAIPILSKVAQFLPLATATLGALPGLREGDPVKAAAGAGLGYLGGRFAKGKAGVTPSGTAGLAAAPTAAQRASGIARMAVPLASAPLIGNLASTGGGVVSGLTQGAGRMAGDLAKSVSQAAGLGRAATYSYDPTTGMPVYDAAAVPANLPSPAGLLTQQNPISAYQANLLYNKQQGDINIDQLKKQTQYMAPILDEAKRREMERQLAAAKVRQELQTGAQLTAQGQLGAQALAQQGMGAIGQGLTAQYQYG